MRAFRPLWRARETIPPYVAIMLAAAHTSAAAAEVSQVYVARAGFENRVLIDAPAAACKIATLGEGRLGTVRQVGALALSYFPHRGVSAGASDSVEFRLVGTTACASGNIRISIVGPLDCYGSPSHPRSEPTAPRQECREGLIAPFVDNPLSLEPRVDQYGDPIAWE